MPRAPHAGRDDDPTPFGDLVDDEFLDQEFYTGESINAPERIIGHAQWVWQRFKAFQRVLDGLPRPAGERQSQVSLQALYQLNQRHALQLRDYPNTRSVALPLTDTYTDPDIVPAALDTTLATEKTILSIPE